MTPAGIGAAASSHTHSYLPLSGGTLTGNLTLKGAPTADLMAATKKYVDDLAASAGNGDMLKSVYDTNGDGIVDNAAKVNGLTVLTAVPVGAKFTDTTYSAFKAATASAAGGTGLVPAPAAGAQAKYLRMVHGRLHQIPYTLIQLTQLERQVCIKSRLMLQDMFSGLKRYQKQTLLRLVYQDRTLTLPTVT